MQKAKKQVAPGIKDARCDLFYLAKMQNLPIYFKNAEVSRFRPLLH